MTTPSVSISPSSVKPIVPPSVNALAHAPVAKPPSINVVPPTPPKAPATVAPVVSQPSAKPPQLTPLTNVNLGNAKPNDVTPKIEASPTASNAKPIKVEEAKSVTEVKVEKAVKAETVKPESVKTEKTVTNTIKQEKPLATPNSAALASNSKSASAPAPVPPQQTKPAESKSKPAESQSATITPSNTNQSEAKATKENSKEVSAEKLSADQTTKKPVAKSTKTSEKPAAAATATPVASSIDARAKRNRFKTIPYQSPTPEIELVSKISANEAINAHKKKAKIDKDDEKLTLFYK